MKISTQPPSGFRDFLGADAERRMRLIQKMSEVYSSLGFEPLETPALENLPVLMGRGGQENEKLIFKILKRGDKLKEAVSSSSDEDALADFGMRFDMTVPLCRVVSEYRSKITLPWKVFHIGPVWRAERAQKGRFREFIQCDVDILGSKSSAAEIEVLRAMSAGLSALGINQLKLHINDRRLLNALGKKHGLTDESLTQFAILLDKRDKLEPSVLLEEMTKFFNGTIPTTVKNLIDDKFTMTDASELDSDVANSLQNLIGTLERSSLNVKEIIFDPSLARGLGYYTGTVFELRHSELNYSLGGGGRYDKLVGQFLGEEIPAVGFSLGFERLLLLMSSVENKDNAPIFFPVFEEGLRSEVVLLSEAARKAGLRVDVYPEEAKIKNQFKYASQKQIRWVVIIGPDELNQGVVKVKDFISGEERVFNSGDFVHSLLSLCQK